MIKENTCWLTVLEFCLSACPQHSHHIMQVFGSSSVTYMFLAVKQFLSQNHRYAPVNNFALETFAYYLCSIAAAVMRLPNFTFSDYHITTAVVENTILLTRPLLFEITITGDWDFFFAAAAMDFIASGENPDTIHRNYTKTLEYLDSLQRRCPMNCGMDLCMFKSMRRFMRRAIKV